jgi:hypothetical protein
MNKLSLSTLESSTLARHEETIKKNLNAFIDVGNALSAIRDSRLYRAEFKTFEEYCKEKWGMASRTAYQLISSAEVVSNVRNCADIPPPANEAQARPLAQLPKEQQVEAWQAATEKAKSEERPVTAKDVQKEVEKIIEPKLNRDEQAKILLQGKEVKKELFPVAMQYARMAISQLERILPKDPDKQKALDEVEAWIKENR